MRFIQKLKWRRVLQSMVAGCVVCRSMWRDFLRHLTTRKHAEMEDILHRRSDGAGDDQHAYFAGHRSLRTRKSCHNEQRVDCHGTTAFGVGELWRHRTVQSYWWASSPLYSTPGRDEEYEPEEDFFTVRAAKLQYWVYMPCIVKSSNTSPAPLHVLLLSTTCMHAHCTSYCDASVYHPLQSTQVSYYKSLFQRKAVLSILNPFLQRSTVVPTCAQYKAHCLLQLQLALCSASDECVDEWAFQCVF